MSRRGSPVAVEVPAYGLFQAVYLLLLRQRPVFTIGDVVDVLGTRPERGNPRVLQSHPALGEGTPDL